MPRPSRSVNAPARDLPRPPAPGDVIGRSARPGCTIATCEASTPARLSGHVGLTQHKAAAVAAPEIRVAIMSLSDTRTSATDHGGTLVETLSREAGFSVVARELVPDEPVKIRAQVEALMHQAEPSVDVILLTGGTGIAPRDGTVEAIAPLFERRLDGFGELFRMLSFAEIGASAMLSRACAGIAAGGVALFLMPGSPAAIRLAMQRLIIPSWGTWSPNCGARARNPLPPHIITTMIPTTKTRTETGPEPPVLAPGGTDSPASGGLASGGLASGGLANGGLIDRQHRAIDYLRVSVTDRCNYRCTYCLPEDGVSHATRADVLSFEEIARLVACFTRVGVRRIRLTGGEPTVRRNLPDLVAMLRRNRDIEELALSTNGHLLTDLAGPLRRAGVDRLNVSIDSLDPLRFAAITRGGDLARVLAGIDAARAAGYPVIKLNTVAVRGFNDDQIGPICAYAWQRQLIPRFIEQMPMSDGALFVPGTLMSAADIRAAIAATFPEARLVAQPSTPGLGAGPARYWRLEGMVPGLAGPPSHPAQQVRFGVISPMTEHFCDSCNRVRLSAAGALHTCLAHDDVADLRSVLRERGEDAVIASIRQAVAGKRDGHNFGLLGIGGPRKAMIQIGG